MYIFMGGTFDPVHQGHIQGARQVSKLFENGLVHLLPSKLPVHKRSPDTTVEQRVSMLKLAIDPYVELGLDLREVRSSIDSYTIDTLRQLRAELAPASSLIMVIGMDSFFTLPQWKGADQFLSLCHILVLKRPNYECINYEQHPFVKNNNVTDNVDALKLNKFGKIFFCQQQEIDVSATEIRQQIVAGKAVKQLPTQVFDYIDRHDLYKGL